MVSLRRIGFSRVRRGVRHCVCWWMQTITSGDIGMRCTVWQRPHDSNRPLSTVQHPRQRAGQTTPRWVPVLSSASLTLQSLCKSSKIWASFLIWCENDVHDYLSYFISHTSGCLVKTEGIVSGTHHLQLTISTAVVEAYFTVTYKPLVSLSGSASSEI